MTGYFPAFAPAHADEISTFNCLTCGRVFRSRRSLATHPHGEAQRPPKKETAEQRKARRSRQRRRNPEPRVEPVIIPRSRK